MTAISKKELKAVLPFRGVLRLIDEVLEYEEKVKIVAYRHISGNETFFKGHFPGYPVMPGHLIAEAMAQACALFFKAQYFSKKKTAYFLASSKIRFMGQVRPGDDLKITANPVKMISYAGIFRAKAELGPKVVAKGEFGIVAKEVL
jgi:3-hydroxyacyl-[acyl-carrier-protein] dehydratase